MAAFATLPAVKAWLKITHTDDDALLTSLITAASAFIEKYCSRSILSAGYAAACDGNGAARLPLSNYPITAVASLSIDGVAIAAAADATAQGYIIDDTSIALRGYRFTAGVKNVAISYTAGFATVPEDIAQACVDLVALRYRERDRVGHVSKTMAGETTAYSQRDMSEHIRTLLNDYRRVTPS